MNDIPLKFSLKYIKKRSKKHQEKSFSLKAYTILINVYPLNIFETNKIVSQKCRNIVFQ
jgi:hypothetical protein